MDGDEKLALLRLQLVAIELQELVEVVKYQGSRNSFFQQKKFHLPFIKINKICTLALWKAKYNPSPSTVLWLELVEQSVTILAKSLQNYIKQEPNYFGDRNEDIFEKECVLLLNLCAWLVEQDPFTNPGSFNLSAYFSNNIHSISNNLSLSQSNYSDPRGDPILSIFNLDSPRPGSSGSLITKLFWLKYFRWSLYARWSEFLTAFEQEYGEQGTYAIQTYHALLTKKMAKDIPPSLLESQQDIVSYASLDLLSTQHGNDSAFEIYQRLCDPNTSVVLMGHLMEHNIISYPAPKIVRSLLGQKIARISCGDQHIAVLTAHGDVYTWGKGAFGRLGHGHDQDVIEPKVVAFLQQQRQHIVQVSCGFAFTGFVSETGILFMCGAGMNGRLGLSTEANYAVPQPVTTLSHEVVVQVQNGSVHSVILTKAGRTYSCGKADFTGHGLSRDVLIPKLIPALEHVVIKEIAIGSGGFHTLALSTDGALYSWGHNRVGQLGIVADGGMPRNDDGGYYVPIPQRVTEVPANLTQVSAGWGHSCAIALDGTVHLCGRNVEGQLGLGSTGGHLINERGHYYQPLFLQSQQGDLALRKVSLVSCGGEHTLFHTSDHEVIGVGLSNRGQLGTCTNSNTAASSHLQQQPHSQGHADQNVQQGTSSPTFALPRVIEYFHHEKRRILQISCGFSCSMVLVGEREPPSLRSLCSKVIRATPQLRQQVVQWQSERALLHDEDCREQQEQRESGGAEEHRQNLRSQQRRVAALEDAVFNDIGCYGNFTSPPSRQPPRRGSNVRQSAASQTRTDSGSVQETAMEEDDGDEGDEIMKEIILNALV